MAIAPRSQHFLGRITSASALWKRSPSCRQLSACSNGWRSSSPSWSVAAAPIPSIKFPNNPREQQRYHHCESGSSGDSGKNHTNLPPRMTISRAARLFRTSKLTSQQLCQHSHNLAHFGEESLRLNAYAKLLPLDQVLEQAQKSQERIQNGTPKSLLDGIPVTIKSNIAVGRFWEMPNACSAILTHGGEDNNGASMGRKGDDCADSNNNVYESDIARRLLKDCGAVIIGITNMDDFGMGSLGINNGLHHRSNTQEETTQQKQYSPTYNPVPWMQRLTSLLDSQGQSLTSDDGDDDYWMQQIQSSTPGNPHGINDEYALADLLEEVQYWVCGNGTEQDSRRNDESPLISPGGSSSGAAATTAHGSSLLSIGTDTGGSIRLPSAWTSTVGFKPSYGTWSRYGVVSYASSLDTVGFITGTTECAEIAWQCLGKKSNGASDDGIISGWDGQLSRDSTARVYHKDDNHRHVGRTYDTPLTDLSSTTTAKPLANIRVGIPSAFSLQELPPQIAAAWSESADCLKNVGGATLVSISESELSSEWIKMALASYYVLACAEASSNLSRYDGVRYGMDLDLDACANVDSADGTDFRPLLDMTALEQQISATRAFGFGEEVQRRVLAGTSVLSSDRFHTHYEAAAVVRAKLTQSLESVFRSSLNDRHDEGEKVDVMLVPTALSFPCTLNPIHGDGITGEIDPTAAFANDVMTIPISLGGFPSVSVPVNAQNLNSAKDCPADGNAGSNLIGMQIFASKGSEDLVLRVGNALQ